MRVDPYHVTELIMTSTAKRSEKPVMTSQFADENNLEVENCLFKQSHGVQQVLRQYPLSEIQTNLCSINKLAEEKSNKSNQENVEEEQIYEEIQPIFPDDEIML